MRRALFLIPLALACFESSQLTHAQCPQICDSNGNTALGVDTLELNTTGVDNTANGTNALFLNTTGNSNTATGIAALQSNNADNNTATGAGALDLNTTGSNNTATGADALNYSTTGNGNTATGYQAMYGGFNFNSTGADNTATGFQALYNFTTGSANTANGYQALRNNITGKNNTADGNSALFSNTTGSFNIAIGNNAGFNLTTGINNIDIGNQGVAGESKTIRVGRQGLHTAAYIAAISGATVPTGVAVVVDTNGHLGTTTSSARFKDAIKPMDKASEAILALKPVTFRYKHELDPNNIPQFGLVAEEVEKVNPDLVARDEQGKPYTVRYEAVNAMLLNEFLKEHKAFVEQQRKLEQQGATIALQQKQIEALTAGLQKVSPWLELSKAAPQPVANNQ
jgi:hypothetical protein